MEGDDAADEVEVRAEDIVMVGCVCLSDGLDTLRSNC
jgi:hypothetical protein